jgi:glutathione peroxidase
MQTRTVLSLVALAAFAAVSLPAVAAPKAVVHAFTMKTIDGEARPLSEYEGKAFLIVNTASLCGLTPQYALLQKLYETYKDRGFTILAFPANDFGKQEPGTNPEIKQFCTSKYKTTFPLFSKISVKGEGIHPLYKYLTTLPGFEGEVKWNFAKFLVDPTGKVVARFDPKVDPMSDEVRKKVEEILPVAAKN